MSFQRPPVHWTPHNDQSLSPEHISGRDLTLDYAPQLSLTDLTVQDSHRQFGGLAPAANHWAHLQTTQSFVCPADPPSLNHDPFVFSPNTLLDGLAFDVNENPNLCNWTLDNLGNSQDFSLRHAAIVNLTGPNNVYAMVDKASREAVHSAIPSQDQSHITIGPESVCQECEIQFATKASLNSHAKETQHSPYRCSCKATFTRIDVLDRHIQAFNSAASIPCPYCQTRPRSFRRQDNLTQHLRGFHHMDHVASFTEIPQLRSPRSLKKNLHCPFDDCGNHTDPESSLSPSRPQPMAFQSQKQLTSHIREVHDESPFPCSAAGCARKGGKGFFTRKLLQKHTRDHHPRLDD